MTPDVRARGKKRAGRGTVYILALLLAASGALRLGSGVGKALANTGVDETVMTAAPETGLCSDTPLALVQALSAREADVTAQEAALQERLAALALADAAIESRLTALAASEAQLSETLARADGAAEADLTRLTAVYETMKPKDASALFEAMDPEFAAGFLGRMRPDAAAAVMSGLSAKSAYGISVLLAGRNVNVPTE